MAVAGLKNLFERYQACFVLHAVGDAMGYRNGKWELNYSGPDIHKELDELGGIEALSLDPSIYLILLYLINKYFIF